MGKGCARKQNMRLQVKEIYLLIFSGLSRGKHAEILHKNEKITQNYSIFT